MNNTVSKIIKSISNILIIFFLIGFTFNSITSSIFFISDLYNINSDFELLIEIHYLISMYVVTIILFALYKIITLFRKNPFNTKISFYISIIGVSLIIVNIIEVLIENTNNKSGGLIIFNTEINMHTIMFLCVAIIFFVLSNFYKKACLIKEEHDFTI